MFCLYHHCYATMTWAMLLMNVFMIITTSKFIALSSYTHSMTVLSERNCDNWVSSKWMDYISMKNVHKSYCYSWYEYILFIPCEQIGKHILTAHSTCPGVPQAPNQLHVQADGHHLQHAMDLGRLAGRGGRGVHPPDWDSVPCCLIHRPFPLPHVCKERQTAAGGHDGHVHCCVSVAVLLSFFVVIVYLYWPCILISIARWTLFPSSDTSLLLRDLPLMVQPEQRRLLLLLLMCVVVQPQHQSITPVPV